MKICKQHVAWMVLVTALVILTNAPLSHSATTSGTLLTNETWSGTVTLTGDVTVPSHLTLTIEPGTEVVFPVKSDDQAGGEDAELTELIINGSLSAVGSSGNEIQFRSGTLLVPEKGDWGGIRATWGLGAKTLNMQHCIISHAATGIRWIVQGGVQTATISNCTVEHTSSIGIYVFGQNGADLTITLNNNNVLDNDTHGIYTYANGSSSTLVGTVN